jgi:hypothetical protein
MSICPPRVLSPDQRSAISSSVAGVAFASTSRALASPNNPMIAEAGITFACCTYHESHRSSAYLSDRTSNGEQTSTNTCPSL